MKLGRRALLAAAAVLPAAPLFARAFGEVAPGLLLFHDPRYEGSRQFAQAGAALGHGIGEGGMADLVRGWREQATPLVRVGGVTGYADMLIAIGMAAEERRPVVFRAVQGDAGGRPEWPLHLIARMSAGKPAGREGEGGSGSLWAWLVDRPR